MPLYNRHWNPVSLGFWGDARVVLVDADDTERKEQYRSFWEKHGLPSAVDAHPARFFDRVCQPSNSAWLSDVLEGMRFLWLTHLWRRTAEDRIADANGAWVKRPTGREDPEKEPLKLWQRWVPNREHWWMRDALKDMPEFHLTVMFRLCTQECPERYPMKVRRYDARDAERLSRWLEERMARRARGEAVGPDAYGRRP